MKKFLVFTFLISVVTASSVYADNVNDPMWAYIYGGKSQQKEEPPKEEPPQETYYSPYEYYEEYPVPVIVSPDIYDVVTANDMIRISWKYTGNAPCVVQVKDSSGNVSEIAGEGNKAVILPNKLAKGTSYILTVKAGDVVSEPFTLSIANDAQEVVEIVRRSDISRVPKIDKSLIIPEGAFDTKESADQHVADVEVKVWDIGYDNQKYTKNITITCNAALADTVRQIFNEIYANEIRFPINYVGCYSYRNVAGMTRLSEHAYGTAIDINPKQNYQLYDDGTSVGECYEPYKNPYSLTPDIINIFRKYNFEWGASFKDYMHFSYFGT